MWQSIPEKSNKKTINFLFFFTGYGHQTPLSPEGKSFCIIYGLIGIPMTMLLVTAVVERLMVPVNLLLIWLNNTMGHLYSPFSLRLFHLGLVSAYKTCCLLVFFMKNINNIKKCIKSHT